MRILFVADGRSPTALNWMRYFVQVGHEVHLASSFRAKSDLKLASQQFIPVAFSERAATAEGEPSAARKAIPLQLRTRVRQWIGPLTLKKSAEQLRRIVSELEPDIVHALRIPFEGMLTAEAGVSAPMVVSIWGNDLTLHAPSSPLMKSATRKSLCRTDGLMADTKRDCKLSWEWGFDPVKPSLVLPGNGGIRSQIFYADPSEPKGPPTVINPRGLRAYVRNDLFFKAIPLVLEEMPNTRFICPAMQGEAEAESQVWELGIGDHVELLPKLSAKEMAQAYRRAQVMVSPSEHDGTPNSLLETMACGVYPVASDLESVREWIEDGKNGSLVELKNERVLAQAIIDALQDSAGRAKARKLNQAIIAERAAYESLMPKAEEFYRKVIESKKG